MAYAGAAAPFPAVPVPAADSPLLSSKTHAAGEGGEASRHGAGKLVLFEGLIKAAMLQSSEINADYKTDSDVPITSDGYTATGNSVKFTLSHTPATGVELMVVRNTGPNFINGVFSNLSQGQEVNLTYGGFIYHFVANYYGGTGNDLVLVWADSRVVSWGRNSQGELGNDDEADRPAAVLVSSTDDNSALYRKTVVSFSAGGQHNLALCSDGTIASWGNNVYGQLGIYTDGVTQFVPVPVDTTGDGSALFNKRVVAVAAGTNHSLALCSDGTVASWGANPGGALGDTTTESKSNPVAVYAEDSKSALFGKTVVAISAGNGHSLALCSDGTLAAWGEFGGNEGQTRLVPTAVRRTEGSALFGKTVVAISSGSLHNLALCSDGTVVSWGYNFSGQLGGPTLDDPYTPVAVYTTQGSALAGKTVVAISAGRDHSLALCSDGTVAAWGSNSYGQLGRSSVEGSINVPVVVEASDSKSALFGKTVVGISAGSDHSLARCADGTAASWGNDIRGQLGDNGQQTQRTAVAVNSAKDISALFERTVMRLSAGDQHNLALAAAPSTTTIPTVAFEQPDSTAGESAETVTVEVTLSEPSSADVTVPFTVSGTANSSDATVAVSPLVIPAGAVSGFISVTITDDAIYEGAETVVLTMGTPSGAVPGNVTQHTLTILDNEEAPVVAFSQVASTAGESAGTVNVAVTLSGPSASAVTVPFTVSGTATGADATVAASPLVIPAGATGGSIAVTITDDSLYENAETVILDLGTPTGALPGSNLRHTLTIADNESLPTVAFVEAASTVGESAGTVNVTVTLSGPSASAVTVPFTVSGTATGADATVAASPLVIPAGATGGSIAVTIADDSLYESAETVVLNLGTPSGAGLGSNIRHTLTITDNEGVPTVAFAEAASTAGESAGTVNVAVTLSGPSASAVTVPFTVSGTATGADATVAASPLVIPAGATGGTIAVTITDDAIYENAETVVLNLGTPTGGAGLGSNVRHTLTITDNEPPPTVTFAQAASTAAESAGTVNVAVTLSGRSASDISVPFTLSGTASGTDASVAASPLVIPAGATGGSIAVTIADDSLYENAETVILTLGTPTGAGLGSTVRHTLTITDNEEAPVVAFVQAASTAAESAGTVNVAVALSGPSASEITVPFTVSGTASGLDAAVAASPLVIPAGATGGTIAVTINDDTLYESAETVILNLGTPSGAALGSTARHTLTITDNETVPVVSFAGAASSAAESAGTVNVAVTLSGASASDITVPFTVSGTASGADATVAASPLVIPAGATGGTIAVTVTDDSLYENAETVVINLGTPSGAGLGTNVRHTLTITDNESLPTLSFAETASTAGESAGTVNVAVSLSGPSASEITVPFTVSGTASGSDAAVAASPLVIPAGATGGTIAVTIADDTLYESAETVILNLGTPTGAGLGTNVRHTLTITDNEGVPTVAFAETASTAGENAGTVNVAVTLSGVSSSDITVPFTVSGTASGTDATVTSPPLVIPAGARSGSIAVTISDDSLYESAETVILTLGTPTGASLGTAAQHTLTITDNEPAPVVTFAEAASTAGESAGTVNVAVALSGASASPITVPFTVSGTASGTDATVAASPLVIPAGATSGTIAVTIADDSLYENAETVILTLGTPTGAGLGTAAQHTLTITDNEPVPVVSFAEAASTAGENAGTVNLAVSLSGPSSSAITVPFTVSGTAGGTDATVAVSPLVIPAGATGGTIAVTIADDTLYENAETVILTLGTPTGAGLGSTARHTLTITDNESVPVVTFAEAASTAGESAGTVNVAVALSGPSASPVTVPFTVSGTASGTDATVAASPLVIPAGATGGTIAVTIADDSLYESAETVILTLGTPTGAGLGTAAQHTLTITDNESAPTVSFAEAASTAGESAGTVNLSVALSGPSASAITVPFTVSGTAGGTDATVAASPLVIPAGATSGTIAVTIADDSLYESAETVILTLGTPTGAGLGSTAQHTLTITDNEPVPVVTFAEAASTAGENAGTVNVAVTLSGPSASAVSVPFTVSGTASGTDFTVAASPLVIPAGATSGSVAVTITDDSLYESAETVILTLGTPTGAGLGSAVRHTLTITDNEPLPTVSFAEAASTAGEGAGTVNVAVALSGPSASAITVPFAVSGTASGTDAGVAASPLVIPAGATSGSIAVAIAEDTLYESAETVILTLGTPTGAGLGSAVRHTLTITDNEGVPTVAFAEAASTAGENAGTVNVAVTLSGVSASDVTIPFTVSGTAGGTDATVAASPLVIPAGATSRTIAVTIADDALYENAETVILTLGMPTGAGLGSTARHTLTITDNEVMPTVAFAEAVSTAGESAGTVTLSVTLSGRSASDITVPFTVSGTATSADATVAASPLVIPAGANGGSIAVTITDDTLYENAETVILSLGTPTGAGLALGSNVRHTLTITDNEAVPTVSFAQAASTAGESAGTVNVAVTLSGVSASDVTVPFTVSGTAGGTDATVAASPLVIPAGATSGSIAVTIADDNLYENAETVILTLGTPTGAGLGTNVRHTLTIPDNEAVPTVSFAQAASTAGESAGTVNVAVTLSGVSASDVTLPFTVSGTASGTDATVAASPLVIPAGATGGSIAVTIADDALYENAETAILTLGTPTGAGLGSNSSHTLTITDNDPQPSVSLTAAGSLAENGTAMTVTVALNTPSGLPVTVDLATAGSAVKDVDYQISASTVTIPAGGTTATFTVSPLNDKLPEADETIVLTLANPVNARLGTPSTRSIVLTDDNDAALNVLTTTSSGAVTEGTASATLTFKVALARTGDGPVSVQYAFSGTASPGVDFTGNGGVLTFNGTESEKTVTVTVLDDPIYEPEETVILTLSSPSGGVIGNGTAVGTILDNESPPVITLSDAGTVSDSGPGSVSAVFDVQLSGPSATAVTLPWTLAGGSARAGEDFLGGSGVLTLAPGATSGRIEARIINDTLTEGLEVFYLQPGTPVGAALSGAGERWFLDQTLSTATEARSDYGYSSAMQEDTLAVSAPEGNGGKGEVVVYSRTSTGWDGPQSRLSLPDGAAGDDFGHSVAVWGDWLVVGAIGRDGAASDSGAAYVFRRSRDGWSLVQQLQAPGARRNDYFGWAVAIHQSTLAVSARLRTTGKGPRGNEGAVYVYDLVEGVWQLNRQVIATGPTAQSLGGSLALEGDTLAAGAPDDDTSREDAGAVYIFERNASGANAWGQVGKFQNGGDPAAFQRFGGSLSLSGKTLAVGSTSGSAVNILDKSPAGTWQNTAVLTWNQTIPAGNFGFSLHLSGDMLAVGGSKAAGADGKANLYFYQRNAAREWEQGLQPGASAGIPVSGLSAGVAGAGGEFAVSSLDGTTGKTFLLRSTWASAFINEGPPPSTVLLQHTGGEFVLTWDAVPGALRYEVEGSDDLLTWENLADVYPPSTTWTAPASPGARKYFRIRSHY